MSNIISNNITFTHMLKLATADKNLSFRVKGQKTESNVFFSVTHIETTSVHHIPPYVDFNIGLYGENLRTDQSVPIDTMLKKI